MDPIGPLSHRAKAAPDTFPHLSTSLQIFLPSFSLFPEYFRIFAKPIDLPPAGMLS